MCKFISSVILLLSITTTFAQSKSSITVAFYNCENFFDTKDDPNKKDDEFLPESPLKWDETRFMNKLTKVAQVLDSTVAGDGLPALVGLVEIENKEVLEELVSKSQFKTKSYGVLSTDSPDERSIDVGLLYDKSVFTLVDFKEILTATMVLFAVIDVIGNIPIIIDLRDNFGGSPDTVAMLAGFFMEEPTILSINYTRATDTKEEIWSTKADVRINSSNPDNFIIPTSSLERLKNVPLYILTSKFLIR